jgi:hypothetical protein
MDRCPRRDANGLPMGRRADHLKDTDLMATMSLFAMTLDVISGEAELV